MAEVTNKGPRIATSYRLERHGFVLDVQLDLAMRGITGIFGPSGAGKTTLLRCMAGLETAGAGRLFVNGQCREDSEAGFRLPAERRRIASVFQDVRLFPHLNVGDNLSYGEKRSKTAAGLQRDQVIDLLGLAGLLQRSPATLSGGEAQRVAIGRALLSRPELILMDEPLASIDAAKREEVLPFIEKLHRELSIPLVYVSHNIDEICRLCDQLVVMQDGRVQAQGALQSVLLRTDLPLLSGREAGAVLAASITASEPHGLARVSGSGFELLVAGVTGAPGTELRMRIRADDVSVCLERPRHTSILNVLPAKVESISVESEVSVLLSLQLGEERLLARITQRSCSDLALAPGAAVFAQIKSIAVRNTLDVPTK